MSDGERQGGGRSGGARRPFFRRRKSCPFSGPHAPKIDYKDVKLLQRFVSERGKGVGECLDLRRRDVLARNEDVFVERHKP